jgi:hypothetical protein
MNSVEINQVGGGAFNPPSPTPTGNLGSDVLRLFTDAANGAPKSTLISDGKAVLSDLLAGGARERR